MSNFLPQKVAHSTWILCRPQAIRNTNGNDDTRLNVIMLIKTVCRNSMSVYCVQCTLCRISLSCTFYLLKIMLACVQGILEGMCWNCMRRCCCFVSIRAWECDGMSYTCHIVSSSGSGNVIWMEWLCVCVSPGWKHSQTNHNKHIPAAENGWKFCASNKTLLFVWFDRFSSSCGWNAERERERCMRIWLAEQPACTWHRWIWTSNAIPDVVWLKSAYITSVCMCMHKISTTKKNSDNSKQRSE